MRSLLLVLAFGLSACVIKVQEHPGGGPVHTPAHRAQPVHTQVQPPVNTGLRPFLQQQPTVAQQRPDDRQHQRHEAREHGKKQKGMIVFADNGRNHQGKHHHGKGLWVHHHGDGNAQHFHRERTYFGPTYVVQQQRSPAPKTTNLGLRPFIQANTQPAPMPQAHQTPVQQQRERNKHDSYEKEQHKQHKKEQKRENHEEKSNNGYAVKNGKIEHGSKGSRFQGQHHHGDEHWHHHHGDGNFNHHHKGKKFSGRVFF